MNTRDAVAGLLEKYRRAERAAADEFGEFSLFGLFERGDAPGRFDILLAAPWLETSRDGLRRLIPFLPHLDAAEVGLVGSLVPLPPDAEFVQDVRRMILQGGGQGAGVGDTTLGGVEVLRCHVFAPGAVAVSPPVPVAA